MEVLNIKTIPHPSQKPKKSEVAMRLGLLETAGRHHVRVRGKRRRAFILLCLLRLPSFARNKTSSTNSHTGWGKLHPFGVSFNPPSFTSFYMD